MRLLSSITGQFETFDDPQKIRYAILSHVWAKLEKDGANFVPEQTYQDIIAVHRQYGSGNVNVLPYLSAKVRRACEVALEHGYFYIWIDTCCIDKSSSAELSKAINSMFEWYRCANVCYVLLDDVDDGDDPESASSQFFWSMWFKRGWTLQELLAPHNVLFLSKNWAPIGTKHNLAEAVKKATMIDTAVLRCERLLPQVPVAERMSWASQRQTQEVEDEAYCLIGVFSVHLTPIYGEGRNAFIRLQKAILEQIPDQSIFAWGRRAPTSYQPLFEKPVTSPGQSDSPGVPASDSPDSYLLASSPRQFSNALNVTTISPEVLTEELGIRAVAYSDYATTAYGMRTKFPLLRFWDSLGQEHRLAFLACKDGTRFIALILRPVRPGKSSAEMYVGGTLLVNSRGADGVRSSTTNLYTRLASLSKEQVNAYTKNVQVVNVYIHHRVPGIKQISTQDERGSAIHTHYLWSSPSISPPVELAQWCPPFLTKRGHEVLPKLPSELLRAQHRGFTLWHEGQSTTIKIDRCICDDGRDHGYLRVEVSPEGVPVGPFPADSDQSPCPHHHIKRWDVRDGIASQTFQLPSPRPTEAVRFLHLTLSLKDPSLGTYPPHYILGIDVLDSSLHGGATSRRGPRKLPQNERKSRDLLYTPPPSPVRTQNALLSGPHHTAPMHERTISTRSHSTDGAFERTRMPFEGSQDGGPLLGLSHLEKPGFERNLSVITATGLSAGSPYSATPASSIDFIEQPDAHSAQQLFRPDHPFENLNSTASQNPNEGRPQAQTLHRMPKVRTVTTSEYSQSSLGESSLPMGAGQMRHVTLDPKMSSGYSLAKHHEQPSGPGAHYTQNSSAANPPLVSAQREPRAQTRRFGPEDRGRRPAPLPPPADSAFGSYAVRTSSRDGSHFESDSSVLRVPGPGPVILPRIALPAPEPSATGPKAQTHGGRAIAQGGDSWTGQPVQQAPQSIIPRTIPGTPILIDSADLLHAEIAQTVVASPSASARHTNIAQDPHPKGKPSTSIAMADQSRHANTPTGEPSRPRNSDVGGGSLRMSMESIRRGLLPGADESPPGGSLKFWQWRRNRKTVT